MAKKTPTDIYFSMTQEELEQESYALQDEIETLRQKQITLARALDIKVHEGYARARLHEMGDAERIALYNALRGG